MKKIVTSEEAIRFIDIKKGVGKKIVFTNGVYDLLHVGHVKYLKEASSYGDYMVVAINSDESVRQLKGKNRPIICQEQRAEVLSSLEFVTYVTIFNDLTPLNLIKKIKPDFLIKGSDWKNEEIVGKNFVESYGGKVIRIELVEGISTTKIIERIMIKEKLENGRRWKFRKSMSVLFRNRKSSKSKIN